MSVASVYSDLLPELVETQHNLKGGWHKSLFKFLIPENPEDTEQNVQNKSPAG